MLRDSLLRILEPVDGWAPMRKSGQGIQQRIVDHLKSAYPDRSQAKTERKLRYCYQIIAGVLQNDLVNDFHAFSITDQTVRSASKAAVADHMNRKSSY